MSGNKVFIDTNIILYLLGGDETVAELLNQRQIYISFITQLELLSYKGFNDKQKADIKEFLGLCIIIDLNESIKEKVISIRKQLTLKLPDCIIAATAIYLDLTLISADSDFKKIDELNLLYYER